MLAGRARTQSGRWMESAFNDIDIEEDDTQQKIGSCMNKTGMKTELCNVAVAEWVHITSCSHSSSPAMRDLWRWPPPSSSTPHPRMEAAEAAPDSW
jgi:hypothetical protein